jgi:hypothetical protein
MWKKNIFYFGTGKYTGIFWSIFITPSCGRNMYDYPSIYVQRGFVWVRNLVYHIAEGASAESVYEWGAEEDI